jgi:dolichyl-phosphate beta-glucosyltransferase
MNIELSVVIPAYNEQDRLGQTVQTVLAYLNAQWAGRAELIVVDDGSTDDTAQIAARQLAGAGATPAHLVRLPANRGKGFAVRAGLLRARGGVALFSDADLSTPITETPKVVAPIQQGEFEVVFGSRALDRQLIEVRQPWRREQGGRVFNQLVRWLTGLRFHDTQCGFKAFQTAVCRPLFEAGTIDRFGFDVELLWVAQVAGLRLRETAVRWVHQDGSKVRFWRDSLRMLNEMYTIRRQARRGAYDSAIRSVQAALQPRTPNVAASAVIMPEQQPGKSNPAPARELLAKARHV